jgi:transmembrane 9 superfamily protein 2/4
MLLIILLWFGISAPLSWIGAYFGAKHGVSAAGLVPSSWTLNMFIRLSRIPSVSTRFLAKFRRRPNTCVLGCVHVKLRAYLPLTGLQAAALLAGILPFGAAFVELYFMLSSLFASRAYYAFGFLALTAGVVGLTTATATILFTYFVLCAEEYRLSLSIKHSTTRA